MIFASSDVRFRSRVEQTAAAIRKAILEGRLKWGERLVESKLAATFKIGQPTVREALIQLEYQGFLTRVPHHGTFVYCPSFEQAVETYRVREHLEVFALQLARKRVTPEGLERVRANFQAMEVNAAQGNQIAFLEADLAFHRSIWELSGNKCLANMLELLTGPVLTAGGVMRRQLGEGAYQIPSVPWHEPIIRCLTEGTDEDVEKVMHAVYANFVADFRRLTNEGAVDKGESLPGAGEELLEAEDSPAGSTENNA